MSDLKMSCPLCGGNILFAKEISGETTFCPHCHQQIILGKKPQKLICIFLVCLFVALTSIVSWYIWSRKNTLPQVPHDNLVTINELKHHSENRGVEELCRTFYERMSSRDFQGVHQLLSSSCKPFVGETEMAATAMGPYTFLGLDSVTYLQNSREQLALAKARRVAHGSLGDLEAVREIKCVKEQGQWKLFRDLEWMDKIVDEFARSGFGPSVRTNIDALRSCDRFSAWPANVTNALERVFDRVNGLPNVFPWDLLFSVTSNHLDNNRLEIFYSLTNTSARKWNNAHVKFALKQSGVLALEGTEILPELGPHEGVAKSHKFYNKKPPVTTTHYGLDVFYHLCGKNVLLQSNVQVVVHVRRLDTCVKFDVIKASFSLSKSLNDAPLWVARVDYRINNISNEPLDLINLKFVWFTLEGEMIDESTERIVGYGDIPWRSQQVRSGFVLCGVGYQNQRLPVKVDIFLEHKDNRWPLSQGIIVR